MSKKGGDKAAKQERADEMARQARITQGTQEINQTFDGTPTGTGKLAAGTVYDPTAKYYNADGSVWTPPAPSKSGTSTGSLTGMYGGGNSGAGAAQTGADQASAVDPTTAAFQAALANGSLYSGEGTTGGFNDDFWNQRAQSYIDYANPQITSQYNDAVKQLTYSLDRSGTLDSSVRAQKLGDLQKLYDQNLTQMNDQAQSYVNSGKTSVEDARSNLISTLNATGDAQQAANDAIARSQTLAQAPTYSPLTNLFVDFTNTLGNAQAQNYSLAAATGYGGGANPGSTAGLYGYQNSVKTT